MERALRSLTSAALALMVACRPCSSTTSSLMSAENAHRAAAPGARLSDLIQAAAPTDLSMDVRITQCGAAMPLRGSVDTLPRISYSGYRGAYSPSGDDSDKDYQEWRFTSAAEMAARLHAEAVRTSCTQLVIGYFDGCGQHGFKSAIKDGLIVSTEPVVAWD